MVFNTLDLVVVVVYLVGMAVFGILAAGKQTSAKDYFGGGGGIPWWAVCFSVVATETSTLTFMSIPAVAYGGNLTFLQVTVGYAIGRVFVALWFLPAYYRGNLETAYQFIGNRFGQRMRTVTSTTFMGTRLLADGVRLFLTAIPLALILKGNGVFAGMSDPTIYVVSIIVMGIVTLIYTYLGGIKAVVWMDVVQMGVYVGGAMLAGLIVLRSLPGGWHDVAALAGPEGKFQIIRTGFDLTFREFIDQPYTLLTGVVGGAIFTLASHGTDQLIVQRLLACDDVKSSQKALVLSGIVVVLQFALFLVIGLLLYAFYHAATPAELGLNRGDEIFAKFIIERMPPGVGGLIIAALFAAAMSTLSSSVNSLASSTTLDLIKPRVAPMTVERELSLSRLVSAAWGIVLVGSALGFMALGTTGPVITFALGVAGFTYGGLLGVFALGMLNKTVGSTGALVGFFVALAVMLVLIFGQTISTALLGRDVVGFTFKAWPWYPAVGAAIVLAVGTLVGRLAPEN